MKPVIVVRFDDPPCTIEPPPLTREREAEQVSKVLRALKAYPVLTAPTHPTLPGPPVPRGYWEA